jgi:hypothetical protein
MIYTHGCVKLPLLSFFDHCCMCFFQDISRVVSHVYAALTQAEAGVVIANDGSSYLHVPTHTETFKKVMFC